MKHKIACIIAADWKVRRSGVYTFVRMVHPFWEQRYDCDFVERPMSVSYPERKASGDIRKKLSGVLTKGKIAQCSEVRLALGYVRMFIRECCFVWSVQKRLRSRLIVLNEYGCELLPIACRLVFPFSRIIAIAHTHPHNLNGKDFLVRRFVEKLCNLSCSIVVFNSGALQSLWEKKLGRCIRKPVVIHHGLDIPKITMIPDRYPARTSSGCVDFVCVGLFYPWKGQLDLIRVWPKVVQRCDRTVRLILVGDGACLNTAKELVAELKLEGQVILSGYQVAAADYFNGGDVAIHMPIEPEAFGLVLLEAMSRSRAVIAPVHGGAPEIVEDGKTGFIIDPADCKILVKAICTLAENEELRKNMGVAGKVRCQDMFSVTRMLDEYALVFDNNCNHNHKNQTGEI